MNLRAGLLALLMTVGSQVFANDLWFPQIAAGGGYTTKITLAHVDLQAPAQALRQLFFYNQDGSPRTVTTIESGTASSFNITVPFQGTRTLTITSVGNVSVGAAKYKGDAVMIGEVATYTFGATAVGVLPGGSRISVSLRDAIGASVASSNEATLNPLAAGRQLARYASEFFPGVTISGGYMIVESTGPDVRASGTLSLSK